MKHVVFRIIIVAAAVLAGTSLPGMAQSVTRSRQVPGLRPYETDLAVMSRAEKDSVRMVAELWKLYVESFTSRIATEERRRSMWMDGAKDYLLEFDDGAMLYSSFRENRIIDIKKIGDGTYEIVAMTRSKLPGEDYYDWVESVYRLCAMSVVPSTRKGSQNNPFRLCNWLDAVIPTLTKTSYGCLDYFCAPGCTPPKRTAANVAGYAANLADEYCPGTPLHINYVVGPTVDQCRTMSGFLFNAYSNPLMGSATYKGESFNFYGKAFGDRTVLSNYYDDKYDLSLLVLKAGWPEALPMVLEGIAAYHGGYMEFSYDDLKAALRRFLGSGSHVDLADEEQVLDTSVLLSGKRGTGDVVVPLEGILGAVLAEYSLKNGGTGKVQELLRCKDYGSIFETVGIQPGDIASFIREASEQ